MIWIIQKWNFFRCRVILWPARPLSSSPSRPVHWRFLGITVIKFGAQRTRCKMFIVFNTNAFTILENAILFNQKTKKTDDGYNWLEWHAFHYISSSFRANIHQNANTYHCHYLICYIYLFLNSLFVYFSLNWMIWWMNRKSFVLLLYEVFVVSVKMTRYL